MYEQQRHSERKESQYRLRFMASVIAAELIALAFFNFWPIPEKGDENNQQVDFSNEVLAVEDVVRTQQESQPASPPEPQIPLPEPSDEVIEDEILELDNLNLTDFSDSASVAKLGNEGESNQPVSNPATPPSIIRIVEPTVPEPAKKANIKAEIWVNFLVNREGRVEEASIAQIKVYDRKTGEVQTLQTIGYGLTEATLNAALQWKFRPAKNNGKTVKAYTRQIFTYGF